MEILACSCPKNPAIQSPKSFPYDSKTLWTPPAMGGEAFLQGLRQSAGRFGQSLEAGGCGWLASSAHTCRVSTSCPTPLSPHLAAPGHAAGPLSEALTISLRFLERHMRENSLYFVNHSLLLSPAAPSVEHITGVS